MRARADTKHIDSILAPWKEVIGRDYPGYRNHVVRMATFCFMLDSSSPEDRQKIEIAGCFHDIGIWTEDTLDYLEPSLPPAHRYLDEHGLTEWTQEITEMILEHHRIREIKDGVTPLVELFRKGDLVDFSRGMVKFGLSSKTVGEVMQEYPNNGFHRMLLRRTVKRLAKHPLNPLPMMKW